MSIFNNFVRIGIKVTRDNKEHDIWKKEAGKTLPPQWNKITKSIYNKETNYMVLTGKVNNVTVIDLDTKNDCEKVLTIG